MKWVLTPRQFFDLEMLLVKGFDPLTGFLSQADYESVLLNHRLVNGRLWPIPVTLDVDADFADKICIHDEIELCDQDNSLLAWMTITDKWKPDKSREARKVFDTEESKHPGVDYLFNKAGEWYLGGPVRLNQLPKHYDFILERQTPASLKEFFSRLGCQSIIGFQTRNPIHKAHMELTLRAAKTEDSHLLIHPVVGLTKAGDIDYFTRVRCYQKIMHYYPSKKATLSLLPLAMRMAGPREALWHALIRKNYGCTHFIVGRDHAGPGKNNAGHSFYSPYAAQEMVNQYQDEIGIKMLAFQEMVYVKERRQYCLLNELHPQETALSISGTELRQLLLKNHAVPEWFTFPEIIQELKLSYLSKPQGVTLFFTGLSGAGKTTLARALTARLMERGKKNITLLDGDAARRMLSNELGFSKTDRDMNIRRIGFVAAEVTKAGGMVLCAAIAPYAAMRSEVRRHISQYGGYIEIYVSTSLAVCEKRDPKGLYAKARKGEIKGLTGFDDPYEPPADAEIVIDAAEGSIEKSVEKIIVYLQESGYIPAVF